MRTPFTLLAACGAALLIPAAAIGRSTSRVVPFKTVAGIPLQLTPAQVVRRLGKPSHTVRVSGKIAEYDYPKRDLTVQFDTLHHPDRSNFVGVVVGPFGPKIAFSTIHGIHMGSSEASVRRAFHCHIHGGDGLCTIWKGKAGAINSTSFTIGFENGKVNQFNNQYVLTTRDLGSHESRMSGP